MWIELPEEYPSSDLRISSAVGKIMENLGFRVDAGDGLFDDCVANVSKNVPTSHLSFCPRLAIEETCTMTCDFSSFGAELIGMVRSTLFNPGQPQRVSVSGSEALRFSLLGVLATRAARTLVKSYP